MGREPYRYRCPKGHAGWHRRHREGAYFCQSCDKKFAKLIDWKTKQPVTDAAKRVTA